MELNNEDRKFLTETVKRNLGPMKSSQVFVSIFSENMVKEPIPLIQLGMAVLMDKPICLLVRKGAKIPKHLKKLAAAIEYVEGDSQDMFNQAGKTLLDRMKKKGY